MEEIRIRKEDQIIMSLVHYFVTEGNYSPILVHGVKNEIWLENDDAPYSIVRINSNRIFNAEQFEFDQYKIKDILKQIKKKTISFTINALNINLNEDEGIKKEVIDKRIDNISIKSFADIYESSLLNKCYPTINNIKKDETDNIDLIINATKDINAKTEKENQRYEKIFSEKNVIITYILMALSVIGFAIYTYNPYFAVNLFATYRGAIKSFEVYKLITYAFIHAGVIHIIGNMYSLNIIGKEIENKFGKLRFILIYLISAIGAALLSAVFSPNATVGASGAIFGLLGAYVYFCSCFKLYFKEALRSQIIPIILLNLALGFLIPQIDNAAHIGGLIVGYLTAMAVGIPENEKKSDRINGIILLIIFMAFMLYMIFGR